MYLLLNKSDLSLYDNNVYEINSNSVERMIIKKEISKLEDELNSLEKCGNGLDIALICFNKAQNRIKDTKSCDLGGTGILLESIDIVVDHIDRVTYDIIFIDKQTNEKFKISKLGEYSYKNLFLKYKMIIKDIVNYRFDDHFIWKKVNVINEKKSSLLFIDKRREF